MVKRAFQEDPGAAVGRRGGVGWGGGGKIAKGSAEVGRPSAPAESWRRDTHHQGQNSCKRKNYHLC